MNNIIKNLGFKTIHEASDGKEGLTVLNEQDIGLIFSGWNMPNMTGIECLKRVRSSENTRTLLF